MCLATKTHDYYCPISYALFKHGDLWCKLCLHQGCSFALRQIRIQTNMFPFVCPLIYNTQQKWKNNIKIHNNAKFQDYEHTKLLYPCDASLKWCSHRFHINRPEVLGKPSLQQKVSLCAMWFHWMLSEFNGLVNAD